MKVLSHLYLSPDVNYSEIHSIVTSTHLFDDVIVLTAGDRDNQSQVDGYCNRAQHHAAVHHHNKCVNELMTYIGRVVVIGSRTFDGRSAGHLDCDSGCVVGVNQTRFTDPDQIS